MTPASGSRGPTNPVIRISPGSVPRSQPRRAGSVQTNLFGGTPDDTTAEFRRHMRQLAHELRAETGEERRISGDEDDPVTENPVEEATAEVEGEPEAEEEEEDEAADEDEEEEDLGYGNSGDDDDDNSPPASLHRPVTQSTSKKQPVSRPKRKLDIEPMVPVPVCSQIVSDGDKQPKHRSRFFVNIFTSSCKTACSPQLTMLLYIVSVGLPTRCTFS